MISPEWRRAEDDPLHEKIGRFFPRNDHAAT
ncbi:hypothetical protein ABIE53_001090 [Burkholderia sp. OAS925]|jgi:hypothetical protein